MHGGPARHELSPRGPRSARAASISACSPSTPPASSCSVRSGRRRDARPGHRARSADQPHLPLLARIRARHRPRTALRLPRRRTVRSRHAGSASTATRCCSIPTGAAWRGPPGWSRAAAAQPGDNCASALKSVVADPSVRLGRRSPAAHAVRRTVIYEMHVGGFTRHPNSGVAAPTARHLSRASSKRFRI